MFLIPSRITAAPKNTINAAVKGVKENEMQIAQESKTKKRVVKTGSNLVTGTLPVRGHLLINTEVRRGAVQGLSKLLTDIKSGFSI